MKEREAFPGGILLLGLDNFARINSLKNHKFGAGVLLKFAKETQCLLPEETRVYRFDGDDFAVIYEGASIEKIRELYHVIHAYSNRPHRLDDREYFCTVSGGIAMLDQDRQSYSELLKCAAEALLRWFSPSLGRISPMEFIPILELTNLIVPVGKWVLGQAVCMCKRWTAHGEK